MTKLYKIIMLSLLLFLIFIVIPLYFLIMGSIRKDAKMCGGFEGKVCSSGFTCKYDGDYPDAAGKCIFILDLYGLLQKSK